MNAERLHALAIALKADLDRTELIRRLGEVQEALQRVMDNPDPGNQEGVGNALGALHSALDDSAVSRFSPSWTGLLDEMGFRDVLGAPLRLQADELFQRTQITPWIAKEEIQKWVDELNRLRGALENLIGGMGSLKIDSQELEGENCEIGFVIPRQALENRLDRFAGELDELHAILRTLSEVATGEPREFEIGALSSSELTVYLNTQAAVAAVTAAALERIISVYRQLLEIRKLRSDLKEQDVPVEVLERLDQHANAKIADAIDDVAVALVLEYYPSEDGRRAKELSNEVRNCLRKLANRVDRGFRFDVRAPESRDAAPGEGDASASKSVEDTQESFHLETIRRAAPALQFIHLEGEPVLNLSEKGGIKKPFLTKKRAATAVEAKPRARKSPARKKKAAPRRKKAAKKTARKAAKKAKSRATSSESKVASRISSSIEATAKKVSSAKGKAPAKKRARKKAGK